MSPSAPEGPRETLGRLLRAQSRRPYRRHIARSSYARSQGVSANGAPICRRGEWREGIAPSRSLRTVLETLASYGSHHPTVAGNIAQCANKDGCLRLTRSSHSRARVRCSLKRLYFFIVHRVKLVSRWSKTRYRADR